MCTFDDIDLEIRKYTDAGWEVVSHTLSNENYFHIIFRKEQE
jgi:hypothetical protein